MSRAEPPALRLRPGTRHEQHSVLPWMPCNARTALRTVPPHLFLALLVLCPPPSRFTQTHCYLCHYTSHITGTMFPPPLLCRNPQSLFDFKARIRKYEEVYEPITDR